MSPGLVVLGFVLAFVLALYFTPMARQAALRFGIALRLDRGLADDILDAVAGRASDLNLVLVAGDALRALGREDEAMAAFDRAMGRVTADEARLHWDEPADH